MRDGEQERGEGKREINNRGRLVYMNMDKYGLANTERENTKRKRG